MRRKEAVGGRAVPPRYIAHPQVQNIAAGEKKKCTTSLISHGFMILRPKCTIGSLLPAPGTHRLQAHPHMPARGQATCGISSDTTSCPLEMDDPHLPAGNPLACPEYSNFSGFNFQSLVIVGSMAALCQSSRTPASPMGSGTIHPPTIHNKRKANRRTSSYHLLSQNLYRWSSAGTMSINRMYLVLGFIPVTLTL